MALNPPSLEQQIILDDLFIHNKNVIVDSVAGSGKTTTNLYIAKHNPLNNILLLTYNKKLKLETRQKALSLNLKNIEVHSYHSFCVKYYLRNCYTDTELKYVIDNDVNKLLEFNYNIIILDEAQDLTKIYFCLVNKIIADNAIRSIQMCILGDKYQSIYDFNNADARYITLAQILFDEFIWETRRLSTSFRITHNMANFINTCFYKYEHIKSGKNINVDRHNVRYIMCNLFEFNKNRAFTEFKHYINLGYNYSEIFILAPSLRSNKSPIRIFANMLTMMGIPIFIPGSDEERLDLDVLAGKVVFSSFHQVKGLERKVVMVYGFDNSYFDFFKKEANPFLCPNEIYVACTRASEYLTLFHHKSNDYLQFLNISKLGTTCYTELFPIKKSKKKDDKVQNISVTDLLKHLPFDIIDKAIKYLTITEITPINTNKVDIPIKSKQRELYENVSDITGIAVPSYFEYKRKNVNTVYEAVRGVIKDETKYDLNKVESVLKIANLWSSYKSGYNFKMSQIKEYDWLPQETLESLAGKLDGKISNFFQTEEFVYCRNDVTFNKSFVGYVDCIDYHNGVMWEFKCVNKLDKTHILQLALYNYLYRQKGAEAKITFKSSRESTIMDVGEIVKVCKKNAVVQVKGIKKNVPVDNIVKGVIVYINQMGVVSKGLVKHFLDDSVIIVDLESKEECVISVNAIITVNKYYLYNFLDDNLLEISSSAINLEKMVRFLFEYKFGAAVKSDDLTFIADNSSSIEKFKKKN
jgi:hypothetical protein